MVIFLLSRAYFDVTRLRQPLNEFELSIMPSEPHVAPRPFPATRPSRATSPTSSSATSIASTNTTSASPVASHPPSHSSTSPCSKPTSSAPTDSIPTLSTASALTVVFNPILRLKCRDAADKAIDLEVHNGFLPRTPVLRPLVRPMLGLATTIPELWLDLTAHTPMSLPGTPVLRPWSNEDGLKDIPELDLDVLM